MNAQTEPDGLARLRFDNRFVAELPADPVADNYRREVAGACYSRVLPTPVARPQVVACAREVAELLDLTAADCASPQFAAVFGGNALVPGMAPYATCYGGHQFGNWAGQLGDGRAINLGEVVNRRGQRWALQLKGAGPTPYSRSADGLAVLRSSVREFLCSEAMHHLGVPTTRALSLVLTGEEVLRDMFYDGHAAREPGAVVCRVAPSFTRFGNFQIFAARGDHAVLRRLVDYTIRTDFPALTPPQPGVAADNKAIYLQWFSDVCRRTAVMLVHWMRVGFVHGVMNTDNMSILGLTIDYGPYGWLENYDADWTPNTTDAHGRRYRFGQQPQIALWNLLQLANAIYPLIEDAAPLERALADYGALYASGWRDMMAAKLGLARYQPDSDEVLIDELLAVLGAVETDMTIFFRRLADLDLIAASVPSLSALMTAIGDAYYVPAQLNEAYRDQLAAWWQRYTARVRADARPAAQRRQAMHAVNPKYVLRNYLAQLAIDQAAQGDFSLIHQLLDVLRQPYAEQTAHEALAAKRPDWGAPPRRLLDAILQLVTSTHGATAATNTATMMEHDLTLVKPDYDGGSLLNLMCSLGDALGAAPSGYPLLRNLPPERLRAARRIVLLLIDGLGSALLDHLGPDSTLRALRSGTMTSVYPPTTATAITTVMTGLAPQQHGLTGWFMHFRKLGAVTAILPFVPRYGRAALSAAGIPLHAIIDCPSFFDRINVPSAALLPAAIADSDFSRLVGHGARRAPYADVADFAAQLAAFCRGEDPERYLYAYWSELDHLSHLHGPSSTVVARHFRELDAALAPVAAMCARHGTLLIITADHGFIDSGAAERIDVEDHGALADTLSLPLCGEPRSAYCYVHHHQAAAFEDYVQSTLAPYATLTPSTQLIEDGWFGRGVAHPELAARVGDYTLQMRGRYTLRDRVAGERDHDLRGVHGGVSAAEQIIPLMVVGS